MKDFFFKESYSECIDVVTTLTSINISIGVSLTSTNLRQGPVRLTRPSFPLIKTYVHKDVKYRSIIKYDTS